MAQFDTEEIVIGGTEWKTAPFRFNRMLVLGGSGLSYIDVLLSGVSPLVLTNAIELNYLKLFGGTEQRNLPSEYTQVEYLQASGTQWIDTQTDIIPFNYDTIIDLTIGECTNLVNSENGIFGLCYRNSSYWINACGARWKTVNILKGGWGSSYQDNTVTQQDINYLHIEKDNTTFNGNLLSNFTFRSSRTNSHTIFLFATTPQTDKTSAISIYYCKISKTNGEILRELIPARRNSDNVLGMYDTVTGTFLTNAGTGTFTAGSNAVPTPDTPMNIICNNGVLKLSKNLFDKNLVPDVNEYVNRSTGNISVPTVGEFRHSDYIKIKKGTQYYVGIINSIASSAGLAFYDDTKTYLSGISLTQLASDNNIITSPNYTQYIRFSFRVDEGYNTNWQNTVYFVEGNQPLAEFMPYGIYADGTTEQVTDSLGNTANAEMLLSVGDYKDTQSVINGNVTKNIGIKVLDGTENWAWSGTYSCPYINDAVSTLGMVANGTLYCSHNKFVEFAQITSNANCISSSTNHIYFKDSNYTTSDKLTNFTTWLADQYNAGTPVIVVYPLATSTTESVTAQPLTVQTGTNTVTITQASIDNLTMELSYKQST